MGEVHEAQQLAPRRRVPLKVVAPWLAQDEHALRRSWREAGVPAQVDHANIVRIISTGRADDGTAYYTMQLVRGISLAELMARDQDSHAQTVSNFGAGEQMPSAACRRTRGSGRRRW
jgi:serine/threonine-protein kinase